MIDQIRFFAGAARLLEGRAAGEYMAGHTSMIRREPIGVVGQVAPWNYPMMMAVWKFAPAIAAGCPVVLKPASQTPLSAITLAELLLDQVLLAGLRIGQLHRFSGCCGGARRARRPLRRGRDAL